jgi:serine protease
MDGTRAFYSSWGDALDLMAPGGDLRVDQNGDGMPDGVVQNTMVRGDPMQHDYLGFQGTSMAAPHVAGVVALLRAEGLRDPDAIERVLRESAREVGPSSDFGAGILQADAALQRQGSSRSLGGASAASVALLTLYGGAARRRRKLALGPVAAALGAFTFGGGLSAAFSWWPSTASVSAFSGPHAFALLGDVGALLGLTAALPLLAYAALAHVRRLSPWLSVLAFGVAGGLVCEALVPSVRLALLPRAGGGPVAARERGGLRMARLGCCAGRRALTAPSCGGPRHSCHGRPLIAAWGVAPAPSMLPTALPREERSIAERHLKHAAPCGLSLFLALPARLALMLHTHRVLL